MDLKSMGKACYILRHEWFDTLVGELVFFCQPLMGKLGAEKMVRISIKLKEFFI